MLLTGGAMSLVLGAQLILAKVLLDGARLCIIAVCVCVCVPSKKGSSKQAASNRTSTPPPAAAAAAAAAATAVERARVHVKPRHVKSCVFSSSCGAACARGRCCGSLSSGGGCVVVGLGVKRDLVMSGVMMAH